jgi:hypothetical protein
VTVNFAPNSPSFFRSTNAPTALQFSIKVQEIEIWTKADYFRNLTRVRSSGEGGNFAALVPGAVDPNSLGLGQR